jgi:hypothetical protein
MEQDPLAEVRPIQRRLLEILTARAGGDEPLAEELAGEIVDDDADLAAAFGSSLRLAEDLLDVIARHHGATRSQVIQRLALIVAGGDDGGSAPG